MTITSAARLNYACRLDRIKNSKYLGLNYRYNVDLKLRLGHYLGVTFLADQTSLNLLQQAISCELRRLK